MSDPSLYGTILDVVNGGYSTFQGYANEAFNLSVQATRSLRSAQFTFVPISTSFEVTGGAGTFVAPPPPSRQIGTFLLPSDKPQFDGDRNLPTPKTTPPPPEPSGLQVTYVEPGGAPGAIAVSPPGDPPTLPEVVIPVDTNDYTLPPLPDLYELSVLEPPPINTVAFEGERPESPVVPVIPFSFTEQQYSSPLADAVKAKLLQIIQADTPDSGLPAGVEQQLFDRGRQRESQNALRTRQEVASEFADRGFMEPPGIMAKRLLQVAQGNQGAANTVNREIIIRVHEVRLEQFRFAITSGIGFEQTLIQAHLAMEQRRFDAARFLFESVLQIFNAQVALYNANVQAYQADAQVFRDRIQAELVKAEIYKAQIDAERVKGEINRSLVEQYVAQIGAIRSLAEVYRTRVDAARAAIEANGLTIEAHRTKVQAYGEAVRAYAAEWEGYSSRVRAALGKVEAADALARIYATRTQAWAVQQQTEIERVRTVLQRDEQRVRVFQGEIQAYIAEIEGERSRMGAEAQALGAEAAVYGTAGQIAIAESSKLDRAYDLAIQRGRAEADIRLENARTNLQASLQASGYYLQALQTVAQTSTQLAGSAMSAINVSGGVSGSVGQSFSYGLSTSKSWGWAGEVETVSPPSY